MPDFALLALIAFAFLAAGTIKGVVGMGLPTTAMGLMTLVLDPRSAIALILVPMILTNLWQVIRSGEIDAALRRYAPFAVTLMLFVGLTVTLARNAPEQLLLGVLGGALLVFVAVNSSRWPLRLSDRVDRPAQVVAGVLAGVMGGLTSVWAPPMAVYLAARQVGKDEFVRASGLLIFLGSLPLGWGYLQQGHLDGRLMAMSLLALVPTFAGFSLGERLRGRLSETAFRRFLLLVFTAMALNLLRRALF